MTFEQFILTGISAGIGSVVAIWILTTFIDWNDRRKDSKRRKTNYI